MGDPASGFLTALSGTYKVVEFVFQLSNVRAEMHIVHQQLELLEGNLRELKTLSTDKRITLDQDRRERINRLIYNTLKYINVVAKPVERGRVERQVNGTVCLFHRITWVLRDKGTVEQNRPLLPIYQADIIKEIAELSAMLREATRRGEDGAGPGEDELNHLTIHKKRSINQLQPQAVTESQLLDSEEVTSEKDWVDWLQDEHIEQPKRRKRRKVKQEGLDWLQADVDDMEERERRRRSRSRSISEN